MWGPLCEKVATEPKGSAWGSSNFSCRGAVPSGCWGRGVRPLFTKTEATCAPVSNKEPLGYSAERVLMELPRSCRLREISPDQPSSPVLPQYYSLIVLKHWFVLRSIYYLAVSGLSCSTQDLHCVMRGLACGAQTPALARGSGLVTAPGIKPASFSLQGRFSAPGSPAKSLPWQFLIPGTHAPCYQPLSFTLFPPSFPFHSSPPLLLS